MDRRAMVFDDGRRLAVRSVTVCVPAADVDRAAGWYASLVGAAPGSGSADSGGGVPASAVGAPAVEVVATPAAEEWELFPGTWLQVVEGSPAGPDGGPLARIGVADLDAAVEILRDRGATTAGASRIDGVVAYCEVDDPFGNRLCFFQVLGDGAAGA